MNLKILLPFQVFSEKKNVTRIVAETSEGSLGILPHRLDFAAPLVPGILIYETTTDGEILIAIDEGILVKTGSEVLISVHRAIGGTDLGQLRHTIEEEFLILNQQEQSVRSVVKKLESGLLRRLMTLQHE